MPVTNPRRTTELELVLPGDWWQVPLESADASSASIKEYVAQSIGSRDDRAQARFDLRQHLNNAADEAREAGGVAMYFLRELARGVPIPINLTTYQPQLPARLTDTVGVAVAAESLAASLRDDTPGAVITSDVEDGVGIVRDLRLKLLTSEAGDQEFMLRADYWLLRDDIHEPWLLAFGSPVVWRDELEPLGDLLDAIVRTASWVPSTT